MACALSGVSMTMSFGGDIEVLVRHAREGLAFFQSPNKDATCLLERGGIEISDHRQLRGLRAEEVG